MDRADVRMVQSRSGASFSSETIDSLMIPDKFGGKKLQRHQTAQPGVFRLIDDTHAAAAQLFNNAKVRNGLTDHRGAALAAHLRVWQSFKSNNFCCRFLNSAGLCRPESVSPSFHLGTNAAYSLTCEQ